MIYSSKDQGNCRFKNWARNLINGVQSLWAVIYEFNGGGLFIVNRDPFAHLPSKGLGYLQRGPQVIFTASRLVTTPLVKIKYATSIMELHKRSVIIEIQLQA